MSCVIVSITLFAIVSLPLFIVYIATTFTFQCSMTTIEEETSLYFRMLPSWFASPVSHK